MHPLIVIIIHNDSALGEIRSKIFCNAYLSFEAGITKNNAHIMWPLKI